MNELDIKTLLDLINKYGIIELEKIININKEILYYILEARKNHCFNEQSKHLIYTELENKQVFTNQRTSIFYLNEKILNFDKIKINPELSSTSITLVNKDKIDKYFSISANYFGNWRTQTDLINDKGLIYYKIAEAIDR